MADDEFDPPSIPEGLDALVLPGIPGKTPEVPEGKHPFPTTTTDTVKLLREKGLKVDYLVPKEGRVLVTYKAQEFWFPVIVFTAEALRAGAIEILGSVLADLLRPERDIVHLRIGEFSGLGIKVKWASFDGPADQAPQVLATLFGKRRS